MITSRCTHPPIVVTTTDVLEPHARERIREAAIAGELTDGKPVVFDGFTAWANVVECSWCRNDVECDIEIPSRRERLAEWWRTRRARARRCVGLGTRHRPIDAGRSHWHGRVSR